MSHLLWKYYWENDVDRFRRLLVAAGPNTHAGSKSPIIGAGGGYLGASPSATVASPRIVNKSRRTSGYTPGYGKSREGGPMLGRSDINSRDHAGLTILLRAASSTDPNAREFVQALLEHPSVDLYAQDPESGWNALHRALYFGNISIARILLARERGDLTSHTLSSVGKTGQLIKTKDHEGNSPFDVYNSTIATRMLGRNQELGHSDDESDSGYSEDDVVQVAAGISHGHGHSAEGEELYVFGSNKNLSLGVGDGDDRQFPERILLQRPDELLHRFHRSYLVDQDLKSPPSLPGLDGIPALIRNRPLIIQDVVMSKLHTAVVTKDPVSNLYVCGVGMGGRLGLGDENTQFKFMPVQGPFADRKIRHVALGQSHSMAVAGNGELWTWGLNSDSQLGYILPTPTRSDEVPMSLTPRQVFGSLKKEVVQGISASAIHSVAHTGSSLYCWGRNVGQLALMDADSRSLDVQQTPRKVAASLLSAPIEMVSAIDKATSCLLSNFTVWIFTNYGYNLVKFPVPDLFTNQSLAASSFSNRYDPGRKNIRYITSGGETIAAVTARGDLFTMQLNNKLEVNQPAGSTTNPVKIKGAVTQPQCIWDSRKDGVASVSIGEHGSVIIGTESGAIWKRVKRTKGNSAAFPRHFDVKKKDFKFERVPYLTGCVNVCSSTFGAFAAIRKDVSVMSEEISIERPSLWEDMDSLMCLRDFVASEPASDVKSSRKSWYVAIAKEKPGSVPHEIMRSANIEEDLLQWLRMYPFQDRNVDMEVRTTTAPDIRIPVHGWLLSGRSSALRKALYESRYQGTAACPDTFLIEDIGGRRVLTLLGVDIFTVLNIVVYLYQDAIVPVWKYTRDAPSDAYRFRQVRSELMKVATKLDMPKLEAAARLQATLEKSLDSDMKNAISSPKFFDDGDIVVELDGADVSVHSQLICQRCPFFEGMFHGRSQGQWLANRRNKSPGVEQVRIDLKHISPETFRYVLEHLYADVGEEMFNEVATPNIDDFSELILDVMGVANELMLDRLSQICQFLIGKFVTTRNIGNLLNEISLCSVTEFKDVGLEYICLQLECMLENHLLDGLDEELLEELDEAVRDNQLARLPFARSGRADLLLHEKYPDLAMEIEEERQRRVKQMAFKVIQREDERRLSSSFKARVGSLDDYITGTQALDRSSRKSRASRNAPFSPNLRPKESHGDMIFNMDEEDSSRISSPMSPDLNTPVARPDIDIENMPRLPEAWRSGKGKLAADSGKPSPSNLSPAQLSAPRVGQPGDIAPLQLGTPVTKGGGPWSSPVLSTTKLDLKGIMSETTSKSALTAGLVAQDIKSTAPSKPQARLSQKERKRQLQLQAEAEAEGAAEDDKLRNGAWDKESSERRPPPWKAASPLPKTSLKEAMSSETTLRDLAIVKTKPLVASEAEPGSGRTRTASPDTRFPGQGRLGSLPAVPTASSSQPQARLLVPHSKSYISPARKAEPLLGASMADIIGQQEREQEMVKEAVAKRSLQEIQQEQAFQEWWDQESRRAQDEEARRQVRGQDKDTSGSRRGRRGRGGRAKAAEPLGGGGQAVAGSKGLSGAGASRGKGVKGRGSKV